MTTSKKKLEQAAGNVFSNFGITPAPAQEEEKADAQANEEPGSMADPEPQDQGAKEEPKAEEPAEQTTKKSNAGRKGNGDKVHSTYKRVTLYMDPELYEYWDKESKSNYSNMTATIQQVLKAEMDKRLNG